MTRLHRPTPQVDFMAAATSRSSTDDQFSSLFTRRMTILANLNLCFQFSNLNVLQTGIIGHSDGEDSHWSDLSLIRAQLSYLWKSGPDLL